MVQGCPSIGVQSVKVRVAVRDNGIKSDALLRLARQDSFVDRSFTCDAHPIIDPVAAVNQVLDILMVTLMGCLIEVLEHRASKLIFRDLKGSLSVVRMDGISTHINHESASLKVAIITRDMQGCELV